MVSLKLRSGDLLLFWKSYFFGLNEVVWGALQILSILTKYFNITTMGTCGMVLWCGSFMKGFKMANIRTYRLSGFQTISLAETFQTFYGSFNNWTCKDSPASQNFKQVIIQDLFDKMLFLSSSPQQSSIENTDGILHMVRRRALGTKLWSRLQRIGLLKNAYCSNTQSAQT